MRAWNKPDDTRERYLGEIAPLLEVARQVESLAPVQKKRVRRRIARTLFGSRRLGLRARLAPVLAALALLAIGGAAFATAQRLGLLPRLGHDQVRAPAGDSPSEARKRKASRSHKAAQPAVPAAASASESQLPAQPAVVLPDIPDPLLYPLAPASTSVWALLVASPAPGLAAPSSGRVAPPARSLEERRPSRPLTRQLAMVGPLSSPVGSALRASNPAVAPALAYPAPRAEWSRPAGNAAISPVTSPAPVMAAPALAPYPVGPPPPSGSSPALAPPAPAAPASSIAPTPPVAAAAPEPKPLAREQTMFGQAMRKLRSENDATGALAVLREHGRAYPNSAFAGERTALEVEALLTLHRSREALALLDGMALDELPRSGERFVVRGELRAAARRWPEANADFDRALARVSGSPAWHERALWGRGVSRLRLGERESGMADIERYRDTYPKGRFAAEAAKFFSGR